MDKYSYETPPDFFERVSCAWGPFTLDAAATLKTNKARVHIGPDQVDPMFRDALACGWCEVKIGGLYIKVDHNVWLNPPYQNLLAWVNKAAEESDAGLTVAALLPWGRWAAWCEVAKKRAEIVDVVGRIKFLDPATHLPVKSPPGKNILAIFRPPVEGVTWPVGFSGAEVRA